MKPTSRSYWSIPIALEDLTSGAQYWLIVRGGGDATNHFHLHGETTQDANYPCYYRARGGSGTWTAENAIHFKVYSGVNGKRKHMIYGNNAILTFDFNSAYQLLKQYVYLPDSAGGSGIRNTITFTYSNGKLIKGVTQ